MPKNEDDWKGWALLIAVIAPLLLSFILMALSRGPSGPVHEPDNRFVPHIGRWD